jgi:hypothetical protein
MLADRTGVTGHTPSQNWPLVYRAPDDVCTPEGVKAFAASLGIENGELSGEREEDGLFWFRLRGHVGGVAVDVTAEGGPPLLDPLTDEGVIRRSYVTGGSW